MIKQPYSYWLMVLRGAGWDRKESPESNLHMCGKDDTKIVVYNMEKCIEKREIQIGTLVQLYFQENHMIQIT